MSDVAWVTLGLVGVTVVYIGVVCVQISQSRQFMWEQIRYLVEGDITQLRLKEAEILYRANERIADGKTSVKYNGKTSVKYNGKTLMEIIKYREEQYDKTVKRITKEMKSSILSRWIDRLIGKIWNGEEANNG